MNEDLLFENFIEAYESMNQMPQDKKIIEDLPYKLTSDPQKEEGEDVNVPEGDVDRAYYLASKKGRDSIKKLRELKDKYPNTPCFYNYLFVAYRINSQNIHALKILNETVKKFPTYVFGKTALAEHLLKSNKIDEFTDLLGEEPELHEVFPNREVFHITEFNSFYGVAGQYYSKTNNLEKLKQCLSLLENSPDPNEAYCKMLRRLLLALKEEENRKIRQEDELNKKTVKVIPKIIGEQVTEKCTFNHIECELLYSHGLDIPDSIIEDIKQLPKETLLQDLLNILKDSILRFNEYTLYCNFSEDDEDNSNEYYFLNHALNILPHIDDGSHLQQVLDVFRQDEEFIEFWFDFDIFEYMDYFVKFGYKNIEELKDFIYEPNKSGHSKAMIISAIKTIATENEDKRDELSQFILTIFSHFYEHRDNENLIDTEIIISLINFYIDLQDHSADELIKQFFDANIIPKLYFGSYEEIMRSIDGKDPENKQEVLEQLKKFQEVLNKIQEHKSSPAKEHVSQSAKSFKDVGRNDPCPCGSGKKYKKCCLNKVKGFS